MTAIQALCEYTETSPNDWEELEHPMSSVGDERWFRNKHTGKEIYVEEDQGEFMFTYL